MASIIRNLIEYDGIDRVVISKENNMFKNIIIDELSIIAPGKYDIVQITKVSIECSIIHYELIKTPIGTSVEGITLTGNKLFVTADIKFKFQYLADERSQLVNTFTDRSAYSGIITLPKWVNEKCYIAPSVLVEDFFVREHSVRSIDSNINLVIVANIC